MRNLRNQKNNMKETWKQINNIIGKGKKPVPNGKFKGNNNDIITDSQDISNHFNDFS